MAFWELFRESSSRSHDAPARLPQCGHYRSRQSDRHGRHSRREDRHGSRSARGRRGSLLGRDPGEICRELTREFGEPVYDRVEARAPPEQKEILEGLSPQQVRSTELAGGVQVVLTRAPSNDASIGGLKVVAESGWFAARPSGTENIYKIYVESFRGADHLRQILEETQTIVSDALAASDPRKKS
jgi:phosphoglucomutase